MKPQYTALCGRVCENYYILVCIHERADNHIQVSQLGLVDCLQGDCMSLIGCPLPSDAEESQTLPNADIYSQIGRRTYNVMYPI